MTKAGESYLESKNRSVNGASLGGDVSCVVGEGRKRGRGGRWKLKEDREGRGEEGDDYVAKDCTDNIIWKVKPKWEANFPNITLLPPGCV